MSDTEKGRGRNRYEGKKILRKVFRSKKEKMAHGGEEKRRSVETRKKYFKHYK